MVGDFEMSKTLSVLDTATTVSIALAAAFEAAIEAQRGLPETEMIVPITDGCALYHSPY